MPACTKFWITIWWITQTIFFTPVIHDRHLFVGFSWQANLASHHNWNSILTVKNWRENSNCIENTTWTLATLWVLIRGINSIWSSQSGQNNIGWMSNITNNFDICTISKHFLISTTYLAIFTGCQFPILTNSPCVSWNSILTVKKLARKFKLQIVNM